MCSPFRGRSAAALLALLAGVCAPALGQVPISDRPNAVAPAAPAAPMVEVGERQGAQEAEAQIDPEALRVVEEAKAAWNALNAMTAKVKTGGSGGLGAFAPKTEADLLAQRDQDGDWVLRATGTGMMPSLRKETGFDTVWLANRLTWVDHEARTLTTAARGAGFAFQMADASRPMGLFGQRPFFPMENAQTLILEGPSEVDGVACDVVRFTERPAARGRNQNPATYRWHIAREDRLPRRIEQVVDSGALIGSIRWDLTDLRSGMNLPQTAFVVRAPEGYQVIEPTVAVNDDEAEGSGRPPQPNRLAPAVQPPQPAIAAAPMAPAFELENMAGGTLKLADLRGQLVLLDFWGTWCLPCKKASPFVQELHEDYGEKGVAVYALAFRSPEDDVRAYFRDNKYTYGSLLSADDAVRAYKVRAFPTYVLIGREGQEVARFVGGNPETTFARIREAIDAYLAAEQG